MAHNEDQIGSKQQPAECSSPGGRLTWHHTEIDVLHAGRVVNQIDANQISPPILPNVHRNLLVLHFLIQFLAKDWNLSRSLDAKSHRVTFDTQHRNHNAVVDYDALIQFPAQN
jgi:hypothetical protein